jgi:hypothetical protein
VLRNGDTSALTAGQIAAHLGVKTWNVTRELQLAEKGAKHRLRGSKVRGEGVGNGGQWRVDREVYLAWLQIPAADRTHLAADGLPELIPLADAARKLGIEPVELQALIRRWRQPHIAFGRQRYVTHNQLDRIRVQLDDPGAVT